MLVDPRPERGDAGLLVLLVLGLLAQISTCPLATTFDGEAGAVRPGSIEIA